MLNRSWIRSESAFRLPPYRYTRYQSTHPQPSWSGSVCPRRSSVTLEGVFSDLRFSFPCSLQAIAAGNQTQNRRDQNQCQCNHSASIFHRCKFLLFLQFDCPERVYTETRRLSSSFFKNIGFQGLAFRERPASRLLRFQL